MPKEDLNLPRVDILVAVFNGVPFINQSIKAIRAQSYPNINLIVIDDGSTDGSSDLLNKILTKDDTYIKIPDNSGLINALNIGLQHCKEMFVLRTDIDDICHPSLIEELVGFMNKNRDYVACGANMIQFPCYSEIIYPENNDELKAVTLYKAPFSHSCVMINRGLAGDELYYAQAMKSVEDVDLWSRLISKGKFHNLQKFLLFYRVSANQITKKKTYEMERKVGLYRISYNFSIKYLNLDAELANIYARVLSDYKHNSINHTIKTDLRVYSRICNEFKSSKYFENVLWRQVILNKFVLYLSNKSNFNILKSAYMSPNLALRVLKLKFVKLFNK
jgi:glycosyltransferase involved in cell wall biosynthesis